MSDLNEVMKVLNEIDPEKLIKIGCPKDEYRDEALILLHRVSVEPITAQYVRDVWLVKFASGESWQPRIRGRHNRHVIEWVGDMPMRDEFQQIADRINSIFPRKKAT